ncbi:MAG: type II toxin-antitoxin system RelE/ParE family toxin [Oscillospiraceae bacterium]|jgi:toxin ParE1/3/4|nr:type II toxin-antitoxin system RelE/ParE family toxin [Oscillospiraceae bacterium]
MSYAIQITKKAQNDLLDIERYIIDELGNPKAAERIMSLLDKGILSLKESPARCPIVDDSHLSEIELRRLIVKNYSVFFIISEEDKLVPIVRILYAKRDWQHIVDEISDAE